MNKQVICDIDGQYYGLDSTYVRSIENGVPQMLLEGAPDFIEGLIKFRGEWTPIIRLRTLFGTDISEQPKYSQLIYMNTINGTYAFRVDKVVEIDMLLDGEFQKIPIVVNSGKTAYVSGACSHHGRILLVVDHNKILSHDEMKYVKDSIKAVYEAEEAEKRRKEEEEARRKAEEEKAKSEAEENTEAAETIEEL
ncbi:MAG: chemotaxis protein CheW [Lachnospiraceae bacterium]|nr:chemotaxis protein CheW [Lachnospiraceae bacterium]